MVKCTKHQVGELRRALHWKLPVVQRERIQMVLLREKGLTQPAIADAIGVSLSTVNRAHMAYDRGGIKALKRCWGGLPRRPGPARCYEQQIGHTTSNSTVYGLLARHGWRKLMPRPFHPKQDVAAQDAFKKAIFRAP